MATLVTLVDGTVPVAADFNSNYTALNTELRPAGTGGTGTGTYTTGDILYASAANTLTKLAAGSQAYVLTMGATIPAWSPVPLGDQLTGLTLSNDSGTPNTVLDIAVGGAASDDAVLASRIFISLTSAYTKTTGAWAVGTGNGGLDTGAIGAASWYHVFLIQRTDTNVVDVLFSLSATAPTMPTSYTKKRRIGSFKTAASNIVLFTQDGDYFRWTTSVSDVNTTNPGTAAVTATLASVPTGVTVQALFAVTVTATTSTTIVARVSDLAAADVAASAGNGDLIAISGVALALRMTERTNTSAQIRYRLSASGAADSIIFHVLGWYDRRGRG